MFPYVSAAYQEAAFRGASQAPALRVTSSAPGCGRRTYTSRSRLRSFNRYAARLAPRAERSARSWTLTAVIRDFRTNHFPCTTGTSDLILRDPCHCTTYIDSV